MPLNPVTGKYQNNDKKLPNTGKTFDEIRNKVQELEEAGDYLTSTEAEALSLAQDAIYLLDNPEDPF